jgi:hypothetical protein
MGGPPAEDPTQHELKEQVRTLRTKLAAQPSTEMLQVLPGVWATETNISSVVYTNLLTGEAQSNPPKVLLVFRVP